MDGKIDYEAHPAVNKTALDLIRAHLQKVIGNETNDDWVELIHYYSSNKNPHSREETGKELADMLPVT